MSLRVAGRPLWLAISLFLAGPWLCPATAQLLGPELLINTYTSGFQAQPAVAADASGNFVVVWQSGYNNQDGSAYGVFGQRFDSAGSTLGSEFQVNTSTTGYQMFPAVAVDGSGNFVVAWQSFEQFNGYDYRVFGQRFNSVGGAVGSEFQVNTYTTLMQRSPEVAADSSGNFVVVWNGLTQDGSLYGVIGRRYDSAGSAVGSEFVVNTHTAGHQVSPAVAVDGSGNFVVAWANYDGDGSSSGVVGQRFDSAGSRLGSEFRVNTYTTNIQASPAVAADGSGNFVVAWTSLGQDSSDYGVFGQRFDSAGNPVGSEFQVTTYTLDRRRSPAVAADGAGNFVVAWQSDYQDGSEHGVFGQSFNSTGDRTGSEFRINAFTTGRQRFPAVAADGAGHFVVAWKSGYNSQDGSNYGVFGRQLTPPIFSDNFELGDVCAWSAAVGNTPACP